mgnify:CR=1 FL=1
MEWKGPKPQIVIKQMDGWYSYQIVWKGKAVWTGSASRHGDCLAAAKRNRAWIMKAILRGDVRFTLEERRT